MPKFRESSADRLWKEKRDECELTRAAAAIGVLIGPWLLALLIVGWL